MRIIDSKSDFYDYYENIYYDPTVVYDRRDSYILTKQFLLSSVEARRRFSFFREDDTHYFLLQVGYTFWLIRMVITEVRGQTYLNYRLENIDKWKNYSVEKKSVFLRLIDFSYFIETDAQRRAAAKTMEFKTLYSYNYHVEYQQHKSEFQKIVRTVPILREAGFTTVLDAQEVFLALEEYVTSLKTDSEKTEPNGLTNDMKIEMHGFDIKKSFRGKN